MDLFSLQFVSDLHLEFHPNYYPSITPVSENIALCGDIGSPEMPNFVHFLGYLSSKFKRVFFIPGNHEYYSENFTWNEIKNNIAKISKIWKNVFVLDDDSIQIGDLTVIGSTLWSFIPPACFEPYRAKINNYHKIHKTWLAKDLTLSKIPITPEDTNKWHTKSLLFLSQQIKKCKQCVVLTHYPPLKCEKVSQRCTGVELAYYNHLPELLIPKVKVWVYGHTHIPKYCTVNKTILASNPKGYNWEDIPVDFGLRLELSLTPSKEEKRHKREHSVVKEKTDEKLNKVIKTNVNVKILLKKEIAILV